jgi:uncharacterized membrane protein YgdD (TMEM256/DUF423 family)
MGRFWIILGCLFCALTVVAGAFGSHALKTILDPESMNVFEIATRYMMFHGVALIALGLWRHFERWAGSLWSGLFFTLGILLFSGSLYVLAFVRIPGIVYLTPIGGVCFILGWLFFMYSVFTTRNRFI